MKQKVIIVGAGVGGLCSAIHLLHAGFDVAIYEKNEQVGGVLAGVFLDGNRFDQTASIMIEPEEYTRFFSDVGKDINDYLQINQQDVLYTILQANKKPWKLYHDSNKHPEESRRAYGQIISEYDRVYSFINRYVLSKPILKVSSLRSLFTKKESYALLSRTSCLDLIAEAIPHKALREALLFQTLYMGLPVQELPSVFATIPAVTQTQGIPHIKGGMGAFVDALLKLFHELGGVLHLQSSVKRILVHSDKACGVLVGKTPALADYVISNADFCYTMDQLLPEEYRKRRNFAHSVSVYILRLALLKAPKVNLSEHNIYLGDEFEREMYDLEQGNMPQKPPIYIHYPAAVDASFTNDQLHSMQMLIRVPNNSATKFAWTKQTKEQLKEICLSALRDIGIEESEIMQMEEVSPLDLQQNYHYSKGAGFGIAHTRTQSAMFRPQSQHPQIANCFFVGRDIHPGNGISMVMKGAAITAKEIIYLSKETRKQNSTAKI